MHDYECSNVFSWKQYARAPTLISRLTHVVCPPRFQYDALCRACFSSEPMVSYSHYHGDSCPLIAPDETTKASYSWALRMMTIIRRIILNTVNRALMKSRYILIKNNKWRPSQSSDEQWRYYNWHAETRRHYEYKSISSIHARLTDMTAL